VKRLACVYGLVALFGALLPLPGVAAPSAPARDGVSFVSGGVGENSIAALKARESEFNLKLVFTLTEGAYLADVGVKITDAAGRTVIEHVTDGPIFMARLLPGTYTVAATYNGKPQVRKVQVGGPLQTAYMRWPADPGRDVTLAPDTRDPGTAATAPRAVPPPGSAGTATSSRPAAPATGATAASGVRFMAGEVGESAEERIKTSQHKFNLKLVFTLVEGNYVADVDVTIKDGTGKTLLQQLVPGPFLLAELTPGVYDVSANYDGKPRSRKIRVGSRLTTEYFRWPSDPNRDHTLPRETAGK
jgi:hypothetical protein